MMLVLASLAALSLQSPSPMAGVQSGDVSCALIAYGDRIQHHGPETLQAQCPDLPGLNAAANAALAHVDLAGIDRNVAVQGYEVESDVWFRHVDGAWRAIPGQVLVRALPNFPERSRQGGADHMACTIALEPDAQGRPVAPTANCVSERAGVRLFMVRDMEVAAQSWRLMPSDWRYCRDEQVYVGGESLDPTFVFDRNTGSTAQPGNWPIWSSREAGDNTRPQVERLPSLCEQRTRA